jgi:hypothetical protein
MVVLLSLSLGGCGAPSYHIFGAYFPAWMFCALLGIVAALAARAIFVTNGIATEIPYQLGTCTAVGVITGVLIWLLVFGL